MDSQWNAFGGLSTDAKRRVLAETIHNLTVCAREGYVEADGVARLRRINEIQHVLTAQLRELVSGAADAYPLDALVTVIAEIAGNDPLGVEIVDGVNWALRQGLMRNAPL
jgi:hypothetical protein